MFSGGYEANSFLESLGFNVVENDVDTEGSVHVNSIIEDLESEEIELFGPRLEGNRVTYFGRRYERDPINRKRVIEIHGLSCIVCGFNFEEIYGERGKDFIEVHHLKPLSRLEEEMVINPESDLVPVCSNCHRMIHRKKDDVLPVEKLRELMKKQRPTL